MSASLPSRVQHELRELFVLSVPIIIAQLAAAGMTFIDVSMSGQYSSLDLAAVAIGASIWTPIFMLVRGVLMAITPIVAQLFGAGNRLLISSRVRQGIWISLALALLCFPMLLKPEPLMHILDVDPNIAALSAEYLRALAWAIPAMCLYQLLASYCEGLADTRTPMVISVIAVLFNIPANYVLIYGKLGFPELGAVGCGYATAFCFFLMALMMVVYLCKSKWHKDTHPFSQFESPHRTELLAHLEVGVPIGLALFIEASIFSIIALLVGNLGVSIVAGHQVALNVSSMVYIIPASFSAGITIRVGQAVGAGKMTEARFISFVSIAGIALLASLSGVLIWWFAEPIATIYSQDKAVITLAAELLIFAAIFQLVDGIQLGSVGALRGYKDTRIAMVYMIIACWCVALPLGYTLTLTDLLVEPMGPHGFWIGLVSALTIAAILTSVRLLKTSTRFIQERN